MATTAKYQPFEVSTLGLNTVKHVKVFCVLFTYFVPAASISLSKHERNIFQPQSRGCSSTSHQTKYTQKEQTGQCNASRTTVPVIPTTASWKEVQTTYVIHNCFQPLKRNLPGFVNQYPNFEENGYDAKLETCHEVSFNYFPKQFW